MLKTIVFTPAVGSAITLHDSGASAYQVTRAEGIIGTPPTRDVEKVAPGRDGVLNDTRFVDGRSIVLEGEVFGTSTSDVLSKWDEMTSAFQTTLLSRGTLAVTRDDDTVRQCEVVLTGSAQPSLEGGSPFLQYQLNLRAPDPRWYGTTLRTATLTNVTTIGATSTPVNVTNLGNAPSPVKFVATNAAAESRWTPITMTIPTAYQTAVGKSVQTVAFGQGSSGPTLATLIPTVGLDLPSTSQALYPSGTLGTYTVTVDAQSRTMVDSSGYYRPALLANTDWLQAYPGAAGTQTASWTSVSFSGATSPTGATCQLSWRDAWW